MITRIEALGYRCLRYVNQSLGPFHVLVGPNASGKTTFLDVIAFLGRLVSDGPDAAIEERTQNFYDLVWRQERTGFKLAIEAQIPEEFREHLTNREFETIRYEAELAIDPETQERGLVSEKVVLRQAASGIEEAVITRDLHKASFFQETGDEANEFPYSMSLYRSAFTILPSYDTLFPVSLWFRELLTSGVQQIVLNSLLIRNPTPPGKGLGFKADGSNLPWVVADLRQRSPERFQQWIAHLCTAFPDLENIETIERSEDRHRYLVLHYSGGLKVPSWMASDGTLRMLALTLPAYLEGFKGIYLIEEPENGIHPRAIETMTQSLSSVYDAQVLLATHSPVILSTVEAEQILCFSKTPEGATAIIRGSEHPALQSWKHETTLGTLFAAGVLG
jgi:predicted ATPase